MLVSSVFGYVKRWLRNAELLLAAFRVRAESTNLKMTCVEISSGAWEWRKMCMHMRSSRLIIIAPLTHPTAPTR
jgi:hypothetical protein